jgi:hypothetical protein
MLRLAVQRLGQARPSKLEICRERDRRTPSARKAARSAYQHRLQRALERHFSGFKVSHLSNALDLERSFGPIYTRGVLQRGQTGFAVLGVNQEEMQASVDAALTFAILWLDACRQQHDAKGFVEGLKLFVPAQGSALTRERMAHLDRTAAKWQLYQFDEAADSLAEIDCADRGNIATRLVHCPDETAARERFADSIRRIRDLLPECAVAVLSPAEIAFRWRGLDFAHARLAHDSKSLRSGQEIVFGISAEERILDEQNWPQFADLVGRAAKIRHPDVPASIRSACIRSAGWNR